MEPPAPGWPGIVAPWNPVPTPIHVQGYRISAERLGPSQEPLPLAGRGLGWGCWRGGSRTKVHGHTDKLGTGAPTPKPSPREGEMAFGANAPIPSVPQGHPEALPPCATTLHSWGKLA